MDSRNIPTLIWFLIYSTNISQVLPVFQHYSKHGIQARKHRPGQGHVSWSLCSLGKNRQ